MSLLENFFPKRDIDFAEAMARKIALQYPAKVEPKLQMHGGKKRLGSVLEIILADISTYQANERMGWIRKARFGNAFRWKLSELGYSQGFVEALTEGVVAHLATSARLGNKN